jgi:hypothetical protein
MAPLQQAQPQGYPTPPPPTTRRPQRKSRFWLYTVLIFGVIIATAAAVFVALYIL